MSSGKWTTIDRPDNASNLTLATIGRSIRIAVEAPSPNHLNPLAALGDVNAQPLTVGTRSMFFRQRLLLPAVLALSALPCAFAPCALARQALTFDALACMSWDELEALYRHAEPGAPPAGFVRGRTIYNPHGRLPDARQRIANTFWKGKHFFPECNMLVNQWLGVRAIRARTSVGESWLDGKPAQVLDYADTSRLWGDVRDEMREVSPGLYVGAMYLRRCPEPKLKTMFVLEARCPSCSNPRLEGSTAHHLDEPGCS